jgi:ABC-type antimicrobial peptide transport system permease subunit
MRVLTVKAAGENLKAVNEFLENEWKQLIPSYPYEGSFQEDLMDEAKSINKNIKNIYLFMAVIATLLSVVGLYSMVSLMVIRRTKEIGIRKVMGAENARIILILIRTFLIIITTATILGIASGYYLSKVMMESIWDLYADANAVTFILPALLIIVITLATMSSKILEAASRNPAESLRYE